MLPSGLDAISRSRKKTSTSEGVNSVSYSVQSVEMHQLYTHIHVNTGTTIHTYDICNIG